MTPEQERQLRIQIKIERMKYLREQYKRLKIDATDSERVALTCEDAVRAKKLEVASRGR